MRTTLLLGLLFAAAPAAAEDTIALVGGTVHTVSGAAVANGTVIVKQGKILAVGRDLPIPAGATIVDCAGKQLTPGFVESSSALGLVEISLEPSTVDHAIAWNDPIRAAVRVEDAIDVRSTLIGVARRHGITSAVSLPAGGIIAGRGAWLDLLDGRSPSWKSAVVQSVAMRINLGEAGGRAIGGSRATAMLRLREVFDDARTFQREQPAYRRNALRELRASRLDLEALQPVLSRNMVAVVHVERASDILAALAWAQAERVQIAITGAAEGWLVAEELAKARVPVIVNPMDNLPDSFESKNARADNAVLLAKAGVKVVLAAMSSHNAGNLRFVAGNAIRAGMPRGLALRAVTLSAAELFGMDRRYGSLDKGKVANLVVWTGDPFEPASYAEVILIRGELQSTDSRQTRLRDKYKQKLGL